MRNIVIVFVTNITLFLFSPLLLADARPDAHAPIGVMGDHKHAGGEFMLSYRYMQMNMGDNIDGNNEVNVGDILSGEQYNYLVSPVDMTMNMHMFGVMYAPTDRLTLMAMANLIDMSMDHQTRAGGSFTTKSDGFGDTSIGGVFELKAGDGTSLLFNFGLSLPTGSIDETDVVPPISTTEESQLPFPMQIGSGTYDINSGLTYTQLNADTSWGAQIKAIYRLSDNDNGYTKGNRIEAQIWHGWLLNDHVSLSTRVSVADWRDYDGQDEEQALPLFNPMMSANTVPTVDPSLRGGTQADFAAGINTAWGHQVHRVAAEVAYPLWRELDGPQLGTDLTFTLGYQIAF